MDGHFGMFFEKGSSRPDPESLDHGSLHVGIRVDEPNFDFGKALFLASDTAIVFKCLGEHFLNTPAGVFCHALGKFDAANGF